MPAPSCSPGRVFGVGQTTSLCRWFGFRNQQQIRPAGRHSSKRSSSMQYCATCSRLYSDETQYCPKHGLPLEPRDEFAIGTLVCGRYEIVRSLGNGAMGEVFLVLDRKLHSGNNQRAMKVPLARLLTDKDYLARLTDEAEKTLSLHHESIVRSFNLETTESGTPLLLMEFVEGESLRWWMDREPRLQWRHIREITLQIARALESAHSAGIVHCDIKPENVRSTL